MFSRHERAVPGVVPHGASGTPEVDAHDVQLAGTGDVAAFERLYRTRIGPVSRYVGAIVRDADRAEDVTAQTFLLAWRDLVKLRDVRRFDAWLFRIAHNQAVNDLARRTATTRLDEAPEIPDTGRFGSPAAEFERARDVERMRDAITLLPETQRQVLLLRHFDGLSPKDIAERIGKTEQSVWALTRRALRNLQRVLREEA